MSSSNWFQYLQYLFPLVLKHHDENCHKHSWYDERWNRKKRKHLKPWLNPLTYFSSFTSELIATQKIYDSISFFFCRFISTFFYPFYPHPFSTCKSSNLWDVGKWTKYNCHLSCVRDDMKKTVCVFKAYLWWKWCFVGNFWGIRGIESIWRF